MSSNLSINSAEAEQMDAKRIDALKANLENLRSRLMNFAVLDRSGQSIGEVRDLTLDAEQKLSLIVAQPDVYRGYRFLLIGSKLIQKVNSPARSLIVNLNQIDVSYLPEYTFPNQNQPISSFSTSAGSQHSISSTPASEQQKIEATSKSERNLADVRVDDLLEYSLTPKVIADELDREDAPDLELVESEHHPVDPLTNTTLTEIENTSPEPTEAMIEEVPQPKAEAVEITSEVVQEKTLSLLEERLIVNPQRHKIGEVIIRKEIETRMVEVPIRRERLVIERIGENPERLAEIDLSPEEIAGLNIIENSGFNQSTQSTVKGEFNSPRNASQLLDAIAKLHHHNCQTVRIELVLKDTKLQETYQEWFNLYGANQNNEV